MTSAKTIRHIRALHAQGCSVVDIHLITGVCADTIRGILTAPGRRHLCSTGLRTPRPQGRID